MIVALLVLIVLILLFGAGIVKGWLKSAITLGCGGLIIVGVLVWLGSFFGENGLMYVVCGILGLLFLLYLVGAALEGNAKSVETSNVISKPARRRTEPIPSEQATPLPPSPAKQVWTKFAHDIQHRFDLSAQLRAHALYQAGKAEELEQFCAETLASINQHSPGRSSPS